MRTRAMTAAVALASLLLAGPPGVSGSAPSDVVLEPVEPLGGSWSSASAVNADGVVVGATTIAGDWARAFVTDPATGAALDLGTLGGEWSAAYAVNAAGVTVGASGLPDFSARAFAWDPGTGVLVDLGTLGGPWSSAHGINTHGTIVGESLDAGGNLRAFVLQPGAGMVALGTLGGSSSQAYGVNDDGVVVGESQNAAGALRAFRTAGSALEDLGTLGGASSRATAISASGRITGSAATAAGDEHAFLFQPGMGLLDLGTLGGATSSGEAVNGRGHVVGWSLDGDGRVAAFLWTPEAGMVDLNALVALPAGVRLTAAYGINDAGQIVGYGTFSGRSLGFRLTMPVEEGPGEDVTPPVIHAVAVTPDILWPPRHEMVSIGVSVSASDDSGEAPRCAVTGVASSEPDHSAESDDLPGDIELVSADRVRVRAERLGSGGGRVYTLTVTCSDGSGNESAASGTVRVPHSSSDGKLSVSRTKAKR